MSGAHSCVSSKIHLGEQGNEADQLLLSRWSLWTMAHLIYVNVYSGKLLKMHRLRFFDHLFDQRATRKLLSLYTISIKLQRMWT